MEDNKLPPVQSAQTDDTTNALESADANAPVSSYSLPSKNYPIENLEVHREGQPVVKQAETLPSVLSIPFSRRRAMTVSLLITIVVVLITGAISVFFVRWNSPEKSQQNEVQTQDVSFGSRTDSTLPELEGEKGVLLVNGDLVTRGKLKVVSSSFTATFASAELTANQTITMPNASGVICLDANNCNFATAGQITALQAQVTANTAQLDQIVFPESVDSINGQNGAITIQGSLNRINVTTAGGVITLSTPQDLDANANVQFGSLTLGPGGQIIANGLSFSDAGRVFTFPAGGLASQEICTDQGNCGTGGGSVTSLNSMTGAITIQGTANQINVASGAGLITLSTPQDIATTSSPTFGGLTIDGIAAIGSGSVNFGAAGLSVDHTSNVGCVFACGAMDVLYTRTANANLSLGIDTGVLLDGAGTLSAAGLNIKSGALVNGGSIVDNYGLRISTQTVGGNDYGIYVENADTYAIWVDAGATRLDGTLEVQAMGATNTSAYLCRNASNQLAACSTTSTGSAFVQGGNNFGGIGTLGLTSGNDLNVITANTTRLTVQADGDVAFDTDTLFVDAANNRVGIGTASPVVALDVDGSAWIQQIAGIGNNSVTTGIYGLNVQHSFGDGLGGGTNCTSGCYGTFTSLIANNPSSVTSAVGTWSRVRATSTNPGFTLPAAYGYYAASNTRDANSTITDNYGIFVQSQTAGTNDYGVFIQAADTAALWVDGVTELNTITAIGNNASASALAPVVALAVGHSFSIDCEVLGCYGVNSTIEANNVTGTNPFINNFQAKTNIAAGTLGRAVGYYAADGTGAGTLTDNYGLYVANLTKGTNDYGLYVQGADTYALWVDAGATRLDGTLEVQTLGATDTATYLCRNSSNQLAACSGGSSGSAFVQGGNNFGGTGTLGLTSSNDLDIITNSATRLTVQADGDLAADTDTLFVDAANNRVGIGTAAPSATLDIDGDLRITSGGSGSRVISGYFSDVFAGVGDHATYFQTYATNENTFLNVAANGSGTTSGVILHGTGFDNNSLGYIQYTTGTGLDLATVNPLSGGGGSINLITESSGNVSAARLTITEDGVTTFNPTGVDADFNIESTSDANAFYLDASTSRIGLGTATPSANLSFGNGADRTINVVTAGAGAGNNLTVQAGGGFTTGNNAGGNLILQGGASNGTGTAGAVYARQSIASSADSIFEVQMQNGDTILDVYQGSGYNVLALGRDGVSNGSEVMFRHSGAAQWSVGVDDTGFTGAEGFFLSLDDTTQVLGVSNSNGSAIWRNSANSATAFQVQTSGGGATLFNVDTSNSEIELGGALLPNAAGTLDIGSTTLEFDELYLGDDSGLVLGLDQNATLGYDETTDDRVELTGTNAGLFIEDRLTLGVQAVTTDGTVGGQDVTPTSSYMAITVTTTGDEINIVDTSAKDGDTLIIVNEDPTAGDVVNIDSIDGQIELSADPIALAQCDTLMLIFNGTRDRWMQVSYSDNLC